VLVPIKCTFHYFPLNGSLKTDFGIEKFAARKAASRLFIEFSMRYTSTNQEKVKLLMNGETLDANLIGGHREINSATTLMGRPQGLEPQRPERQQEWLRRS
jgi:hypothetical protein